MQFLLTIFLSSSAIAVSVIQNDLPVGSANMGSDGAAEETMLHRIHDSHQRHSLRLLNRYNNVHKGEPSSKVNHVPGPEDVEWHAQMSKHGDTAEKFTDEDYLHDKQPSFAFIGTLGLVFLNA